MTVQMHAWENSLLSLAQEAWQSRPAVATTVGDETLLEQAYAHCEAITAVHSRSFHLASGLLPAAKRRAARALYAFCRTADDLVDNPNENPQAALARWHRKVFSLHPPTHDLVAVAWTDTRARYKIPQGYSEQLLEGISRDLVQTRYENFDDLVTYAYGVASTVGLMSMHIIGFTHPDAVAYAIKLGVALQITNILRDVAEDWQRGRIYLPQEELAFFGLSEDDLDKGQIDNRWRAFMKFQIERNRQLYHEAWPGIALLEQDGRFAITAAAELYRGILDDIEQHNYDVFTRRAHVSAWGKLRRLPGIWWRSKKQGSRVAE
jgi:phytoene synthase